MIRYDKEINREGYDRDGGDIQNGPGGAGTAAAHSEARWLVAAESLGGLSARPAGSPSPN